MFADFLCFHVRTIGYGELIYCDQQNDYHSDILEIAGKESKYLLFKVSKLQQLLFKTKCHQKSYF